MRTLIRMTLAAAIAAAMPALAAGQSGSAMQADTAGRHDMGMRHGTKHGMSASMGGSMGLSRAQVMELQQSLTSAGCDAGTADGRIGPKTHRALQCAEQKNKVTSGNVNELFRAMNLSFTVSDSMAAMHQRMHGKMDRPMRGTMKHGGMRDSTGMRDSSGMAHHDMGAMGSGADSSRTKPPRR
jgi:hypothetical protein